MILFKAFGRANIIMDESEQRDMISFFKNMQYILSFERNLQKCYNHHLHFATLSPDYNLCTDDILDEIVRLANSTKEDEYITIFGTAHTNFHVSYALYDQLTHNMGVEVRDTYISIKLPNSHKYYHILIAPPETRHPYLNFIVNAQCGTPTWLIYPTPSLR